MPATTRPASRRPDKTGGKGRKNLKAPVSGGMSTNLKFTLGVLAAVALIVGGAVFFAMKGGSEPSAAAANLVRADSHRISTAADGKVTIVEFLDFECPSCGRAYPAVEQLRKEYAGKITYVVREFPLEMHPNAMNAAAAAEAAANQGKFEAMYTKLFSTQQTWGGQQADHAKTFDGYAEELGLDMAKFRADVASQQVRDRIATDQADGAAAGARGTPTFFVNGELFEPAATYDNLKAAIDAALAG
nr:thioredoxin domain-containing protein [Catellatospora coxensis]